MINTPEMERAIAILDVVAERVYDTETKMTGEPQQSLEIFCLGLHRKVAALGVSPNDLKKLLSVIVFSCLGYLRERSKHESVGSFLMDEIIERAQLVAGVVRGADGWARAKGAQDNEETSVSDEDEELILGEDDEDDQELDDEEGVGTNGT